MRLHMIGLPHAQTTHDISVCAFTTKLIKFCEMMKPWGYEIVLYSGDNNDADVFKHVQVYSEKEQRDWFGDFDQNTLPTVATWDANDPQWRRMNKRVIDAIWLNRDSDKDIICLLAGWAQKPIADAFPGMIICEWAAGYEGWFTNFVCFESQAWMHHCYGKRDINDGRWFDAVIPNFFREEDFAVAPQKRDYVAFVGRLIQRKGLSVAYEIAKRAEKELVIAGSGAASYEGRTLITQDGQILEDVEYIGTVGTKERNKLMSEAVALIAPTTYIEPFGAVAVEAQLCGTPAITTDWGAFPETVEEGITGFRFRTLGEGVHAVKMAEFLDPGRIRSEALEKYSLDAIAPIYDNWFKRLNSLWSDGWYK